MGLISTAINSVAGAVQDNMYKEFFYCDSLPVEVLMRQGKKRVGGRGGNNGADNIITSGSVVSVADGQCMLIVDNGKVAELCAQPGEFVYDASTEPSILGQGLSEAIKTTFEAIGKRFVFGGTPPKDQRVYYINTKEIIGNKYGTANPVPFRVVDERAGIDMDFGLKCFGEYSYRITNPIQFYTVLSGNITGDFTRDKIDSQLKSELLTALQPAFGRISEMGIRYSALTMHTREIADSLNEILSRDWKDGRGIEIVSFGVSSVKLNEEDEQTIKEMQKRAALTNPNLINATMAQATADAMVGAANNQGAGPMMAFMGMNMANNMGNMAAQGFQQPQMQQPQMQQPQQPAPQMQPAANAWTCSCGTQATGKFCPNCGSPRPAEAAGWTCSCGTVNKGKFCAECGKPKPAGVPQYRCDKCGWEPEDPANPPKFCPECGDPFGDEDVK